MKALKTLLIIVAVIVIIPLLGFAGWFVKKGFTMEILAVNKSMIEFKGSENYAVNYVLNSEKIVTSGNRRYQMNVDHIGLHWNEGDYKIKYPRLKDLSRIVEKTDLVYFADALGIQKSNVRALQENEEDRLEYGGINNTDYTLCRQFIQSAKPLIIESSFFGPPTESLVRYNMEKLTDVYYTGWRGKYVKNLSASTSDEDCSNMAGVYKEISGEDWTFTGPGIIIINEDVSRMIVLEEGTDIATKEGLIATREASMERFDLPAAVNYNGWFTILHPGNNEVLSIFELNPSISGKEKLNANGLPETFPALIEVDDNFYCMTGDFGKCKVNLLFSRVMVINKLVSAVKSNGVKNPDNFFYTYYQPFMTNIIKDAKQIKLNEE